MKNYTQVIVYTLSVCLFLSGCGDTGNPRKISARGSAETGTEAEKAAAAAKIEEEKKKTESGTPVPTAEGDADITAPIPADGTPGSTPAETNTDGKPAGENKPVAAPKPVLDAEGKQVIGNDGKPVMAAPEAVPASTEIEILKEIDLIDEAGKQLPLEVEITTADKTKIGTFKITSMAITNTSAHAPTANRIDISLTQSIDDTIYYLKKPMNRNTKTAVFNFTHPATKTDIATAVVCDDLKCGKMAILTKIGQIGDDGKITPFVKLGTLVVNEDSRGKRVYAAMFDLNNKDGEIVANILNAKVKFGPQPGDDEGAPDTAAPASAAPAVAPAAAAPAPAEPPAAPAAATAPATVDDAAVAGEQAPDATDAVVTGS